MTGRAARGTRSEGAGGYRVHGRGGWGSPLAGSVNECRQTTPETCARGGGRESGYRRQSPCRPLEGYWGPYITNY